MMRAARVAVIAVPAAGLSASDVADRVGSGWQATVPDAEVKHIMVTSGDHFVDTLAATHGEAVELVPLGDGAHGVRIHDDVVIDEPLETPADAVRVGTLTARALAVSPGRVIQVAGHSPLRDLGFHWAAGLAEAQGIDTRGWSRPRFGNTGWPSAPHLADLGWLTEVHRRIAGEPLLVAATVNDVVLGPEGLNAQDASVQAQLRERQQGEIVAALVSHRVGASDRSQVRRSLTTSPGSGAGGGIGFVAAFVGGQTAAAIDLSAAAAQLDSTVASVDLAVFATPTLDLHDHAVAKVTIAAQACAVPLIVITETSSANERSWRSAGINGVYLAGRDTLGDRGRAVARTWGHVAF